MTNFMARRLYVLAPLAASLLPCCIVSAQSVSTVPAPTVKHNVIIFVADGLRRNSVTPADMPTLARMRAEGVDFRNSHSVFPTFTTANASVIATGHALGDTGDFSNTIYPGNWLGQANLLAATGSVAPFLEADDVLADLNGNYSGNYLGEQTLLSAARAAGYSVASVGKLEPTAIQQIDAVARDEFGHIRLPGAIIVDDSTGHSAGVPLPLDLADALNNSGLPNEAPLRTNGFPDSSPWSNGFSGDAVTGGTRAANLTQSQWFADVTTKLLLPRFAEAKKPFVLFFWSRDPDGTQHNQGDSLQITAPGINGETAKLALHNADNALKQMLDWLDAHPAIKANTDVVITSDHGFATISRRELNAKGDVSGEPSANLPYEVTAKDKAQPAHTLPSGFLAIDLALFSQQRLFDPAVRATTGDSVYAEVPLSGEFAHHPSVGSAVISARVKHLDASDARLIVAANGGSDLIYVPSHDPKIVHDTLALLAGFDYVGGLFVDDAYCAAATDCPGALPLSAIALKGSTKLPTPAIVVAFKVYQREPGNPQTAVQISDTTLQEGQGMHGGFGRDSTWNNMAAWGPDFKKGFVDEAPVGNIDIVPTIAAILGLDIPSHGKLKGRAATEALRQGQPFAAVENKVLVSAPASNGLRTVMLYQEGGGYRYNDRACFIAGSPQDKTQPTCPN